MRRLDRVADEINPLLIILMVGPLILIAIRVTTMGRSNLPIKRVDPSCLIPSAPTTAVRERPSGLAIASLDAWALHREGLVLEKLDAQQKLTSNQWKIAFAPTVRFEHRRKDYLDRGVVSVKSAT
jgi:hypothetical protein